MANFITTISDFIRQGDTIGLQEMPAMIRGNCKIAEDDKDALLHLVETALNAA